MDILSPKEARSAEAEGEGDTLPPIDAANPVRTDPSSSKSAMQRAARCSADVHAKLSHMLTLHLCGIAGMLVESVRLVWVYMLAYAYPYRRADADVVLRMIASLWLLCDDSYL
eukprot:6198398-Pleurochrysis_carterae.AAC.2